MNVKRTAFSAIVGTAIACGTPSIAMASTPTSGNDHAVSTVISEFTAANNQEGLSQFKAAPRSTQVKVAKALTSGKDISNIVTVGKPVKNVTAEPTISPLGMVSPDYATYSVTSEFHVPAKVFGITIAVYHQKYHYETGNGRVLKDYSCRGYWDGFTGINTFSYSTNMHISGGQGYCTVYDQVSLIYKGLGATYEKKGYIHVNGERILYWSLVND